MGLIHGREPSDHAGSGEAPAATPARTPTYNGPSVLNPDEEAALMDVFSYHGPTDAKIEAMSALREKAREFAALMLQYCPRSADRSAAIRKLREAVMTANAAIVLDGRNLP